MDRGSKQHQGGGGCWVMNWCISLAVITFACNFNLTRNKLTYIHMERSAGRRRFIYISLHTRSSGASSVLGPVPTTLHTKRTIFRQVNERRQPHPRRHRFMSCYDKYLWASCAGDGGPSTDRCCMWLLSNRIVNRSVRRRLRKDQDG